MLDFVHPISAEGGAARSTGSAGTTNPAGNLLVWPRYAADAQG